jgi:hypothetical protein
VSADLAALAVVLPDPAVDVAYRRQLARETWRDGYERGHRDGYEHGARLLEAQWPAVVVPLLRNRPDHAEVEAARWHVCCAACRRDGHRRGCPRCEDRSRETFGRPHRDDYRGRES